MNKNEFHNALRILTSIDHQELVATGIIVDGPAWQAFRTDPFRWFLRASDADADKLWTLIKARMGAPKP